jgi:hypothetical protein
MHRVQRLQVTCLTILAIAVLMAPGALAADPVRLKYIGHANDRLLSSKHIVGVETVLDHYAITSANNGICLVDLQSVMTDATSPPACLSLIGTLDATSTTTSASGYVYVNLRLGGLAVVYLDPDALTLSYVDTISEPNVFFERMALAGDYLYVTAHDYGIRIFDVSSPAQPNLVSSLGSGLDDAYALAVEGDTAYVADGAGGLKVIDLSDRGTPVIVRGENPDSAAGTAQDVLIHSGRIYMAVGGAGVAVYDVGDLTSRRLFDTPISAKQLSVVGDLLAVADIGGIELFSIEADGGLIPVARKASLSRVRRNRPTLRLWYGVAAWGENRVVAAAWDSLDLYELVDPAADDQPDISVSTQRVRFLPDGGSAEIEIVNNGSGLLRLDRFTLLEPTFTLGRVRSRLHPGQSATLRIDYHGGQPGTGVLLITSNDPDESPLPVQLLGATVRLDPTEAVPPFTLESWRLNQDTGDFSYGTFDLVEYAGKVVFLQLFTPT